MKTAAVIQAAGKGSRFSGDRYKLLAEIGGVPVIRRTLGTVLSAGFDDVVAVIGAHADEMRSALEGLPVRIIENPDWEKGQSTSLAAGVRAVADTSDRACLLLGDQPFIQGETLREILRVADEFHEEVIVPEYHNRRGNPIVVPSSRYALLLELTEGDTGGRKLLETVGYHAAAVEDPGILRDIDTAADLKDAGKEKPVEQEHFWKIENGAAVPLKYGTTDIQSASQYTPIGAYTTFRTYGRFGVLRLTKHFDRLEETSALAGHRICLDREKLKAILSGLIAASDEGEKRVRVTVDHEKEPGTLYIAMEKLETPAAAAYREGIVCRTVEAHRDNPKAKLSSFLSRAADLRKTGGEKCDEFLMVTAEGDILEGLSSNFYGVTGGTVYTAEEGVLSGTTRDFILRIAAKLAIPVVFRPIKTREIPELDEAFISSTSRSILPVRSIDGISTRMNVPGPVTQRLTAEFEAELQSAVEDLREKGKA